MTATITADAGSRYDRQERIEWWDQDRLAAAKVLVVGAGALGNEVVKNLVLMGVGSLVVVDFDTVELSNLARCVLLRDGDDGAPKALAVAERARELNADVSVTGIHADLRRLGSGIARRADVMVGALDNREARLHLNRLAAQAGRPWVDGAIEALQGVARVFHPPESCYECTLSEADFEALAHRQSCRLLSPDDLIDGKVPTCVPTASIVAGIQAQETVKLLHRDRDSVIPLPGAVVFDGANNDAYPLQYPTNPDCLAHHCYTDPVVVDATTTPLTIADIVAAVGFPEGTVELPGDLITTWTCPTCETIDPARIAVSFATQDDARCRGCGEPRQPAATSTVAAGDELWNEPLAAAGLVGDDVLAVRSGDEYRYVWPTAPHPDLPEDWA